MSFLKHKDLDQMLEYAEKNHEGMVVDVDGTISVRLIGESLRRARETIRLAHFGMACEQAGIIVDPSMLVDL